MQGWEFLYLISSQTIGNRRYAITGVHILLGIFVVLGGWWFECRVPAQSNNLPTITLARQLLDLSPAEASKSYPVELEGVVTLYDEDMSMCFVQDASAGVFVYQAVSASGLRDGVKIRIHGLSLPGLYTPVLNSKNIEIIGPAPKPTPQKITIDQLLTGAFDSQWIEIEGIVHTEKEEWSLWAIDIVQGESRVTAHILKSDIKKPLHYVDARVRVHGVVTSSFNERRQLIGFNILVSSMQDVTVLETPVGEVEGYPLVSGREVLSYSRRDQHDRRVRVRGSVLAQFHDRSLFLRDSSGSFRVHSTDKTDFAVGDMIEVLGFPGRGGYTPVIRDAIVRKVGVGEIIPPKDISGDAKLNTANDGELVQLDGRLIAVDLELGKGISFEIEAPHGKVKASLNDPEAARKLASSQVGSLVRLTGICQVNVDQDMKPLGWSLLMRQKEDFTLIRRPEHFLILRLALGAVVLALVAGAGIGWSAWLRTRISAQKRMIQKLEEAQEALHESELRLRVLMAERERISRELHDNIIQSIYAIGLGLEDCANRISEAPDITSKRLKASLGELNRLIRNVRQFITGINGQSEGLHDFQTCINAYMNTLDETHAHNIHLDVDAAATEALNASQTWEMVQIAREGMSNSLRHAPAAQIQLSLQRNQGDILLEITDNGPGFPTNGLASEGRGLRNMEARAIRLGAVYHHQSTPGQGTRISVRLPVQDKQYEHNQHKNDPSPHC